MSRLSRKLDFESIPATGGASPSAPDSSIGSANGGARVRKSAVERRIGRNASSNLGSISENSDFASSRENSFDSDSGVGSAANPIWIKRGQNCEEDTSGHLAEDASPDLPPPPNYQKAAAMPELTLDPSQLNADAYPNRTEGPTHSKVTDSPFNKKPGAIKKVSFNWHQESDEKPEPTSSDTYVYDGALSKTAVNSNEAKPDVLRSEAERSFMESSAEPPAEAKGRRSDLV